MTDYEHVAILGDFLAREAGISRQKALVEKLTQCKSLGRNEK